MYKFIDVFECDLRDIKSERKQRFLKDAAAYTVGGEHPLPQLIVTVAATHAGLMTRNKAFYRPDTMKAHLDSFLKPFAKPVQVHHSDHVDPVGRVRSVRYVDISSKYVDPLREFRNSFGGTTFLDAKAGTEKSFDQVNWILKNMQGMKDYQGLGYGELDLHISDPKTAEKILDERYLTVSVGFTTTEIYCSQCKQDWGSNDGPCEHRPGEMYDEVPMVLIPSNFIYEEVSWVNNPADPHAQVIRVSKTGSPTMETVSVPDAQNHDSAIVPILLGVSGEGIYRLDSYKDVDLTRAQEILNVAKKKDSAQPELVEFDGAKFPKAAETLLATDAKRENYVTDAVKAGDIPEHSHRVVIDPATGNGYSDYVTGHSHSVVNQVIQPNECYDSPDAAEGQDAPVNPDIHTHTLDKKVAPLTDEAKLEDAKKCPDCGKPMSECSCDGGMMDDADLCDDCKKKKKDDADFEACDACKGKKKKMANSSEEQPAAEAIADSTDITDETILLEDFYEKYFEPILDELEAGDAKLSAAQRKGLKASTFCGPNRSFPVPDCAHVTAARRLIGRFKGNKAGILACINRKAKALGCDKSKDAFEPIDVALVDPKGEEKEIKVRIADADDFKVVVNTLGSEVFTANKDKFYEIGKLLGMTTEQVDSYVKTGVAESNEAAPLEEVINVNEAKTSLEINERYADNLISELNAQDEDKRASLVQMLLDKFIAAGLFPNYDQEYNDLVEENQALKEKIARVTAANRDLYVAKQNLLAETIVHLKESLKKPGFEDLDENARTLKVTELTVRSIDSLNDSLRDVTSEITGAKATQPELDADATGQPGSLELKEPDNKPVRDEVVRLPFDPSATRDMDDHTYQLACRLHEAYKGKRSK